MPTIRFAGGMMWKEFGWNMNMPMPLSRLSIHARGVRLEALRGGGSRLDWFLPFPTYDLAWRDLAEVQSIWAVGYIPFPGVRFVLHRNPQSVLVFWTFRKRRVLEALASHGVKLDPRLRRLPVY